MTRTADTIRQTVDELLSNMSGSKEVRTYLQRVFEKLGVHRRAALARVADRL